MKNRQWHKHSNDATRLHPPAFILSPLNLASLSDVIEADL